ncbi:hypothetical protein [Thermofilum sp.]
MGEVRGVSVEKISERVVVLNKEQLEVFKRMMDELIKMHKHRLASM